MQPVILKEQINEASNIQRGGRSQGQILARYRGCFAHVGCDGLTGLFCGAVDFFLETDARYEPLSVEWQS